MDKKLEEILNILNNLNSRFNIVAKEDVEEQYENLKDFRNLTSDLDTLLNKFNNVSKNDGDNVEKLLFELHRILTTFEWHFSEISDINTKILKIYKEKINDIWFYIGSSRYINVLKCTTDLIFKIDVIQTETIIYSLD